MLGSITPMPHCSTTPLVGNDVAQIELILVFIVFLSFLVVGSNFIYTTKEPARSGQEFLFFKDEQIQ